MRIDRTDRSSGVGARKSAGKSSASGSNFALPSQATASRAGAMGAASPVASIDSILALQAVEDPMFAKRKAVKRGESMLDILEELKTDLLTGQIGEGRLNRLLSLVQQAKMASDPQLDALIEDIELRARVELAKQGRFPAF